MFGKRLMSSVVLVIPGAGSAADRRRRTRTGDADTVPDSFPGS